MQPAPGRFQLLKIRMMNDLIQLGGQLAIQFADHPLDGADRIGTDQVALDQSLLSQGAYRLLDGAVGFVRLRPEFLLEKTGKVVISQVNGIAGRRVALENTGYSVVYKIALVDFSVCYRAGFCVVIDSFRTY